VTEKVCLGSDLEEEWGDVSTVRQSPDVGKSKAAIRIEKIYDWMIVQQFSGLT
jgi:hypothetical protein